MVTKISLGQDIDFPFGTLPNESRVIEIMDGDKIKGRWTLLPIWHAEFLESDGTIGVNRRLFTAMKRTAEELGVKRVYTGAIDDTVRGLLDHVGATKLPGDHYIWEMR